MGLTVFIFFFNYQQVLFSLLRNKALMSLVFYVLLTAAWAGKSDGVVKNFIFLFSATIISIMVALAFMKNRVVLIRWLFWVFLILTVSSIVCALQYPKIGINVLDFGTPRWIGVTTHPNALGMQALMLVWLSSNLYLFSKGTLERLIIVAAIAVGLFTILKADSMTSLITSIIIISYIFYCQVFGKLNSGLKLVLITISILALLVTVTFYMSASEITDATLSSTGRNTTFTGRSGQWKLALADAADRPIIGYGFDDLEQLTKKHRINMTQVHNGYIETLLKGGLIASVLMIAVLLKTFLHLFLIRRTLKDDFVFISSGFVMILLHNFTETSFLRALNPLGFIMVYLVVSTSILRINGADNHPTGLKL
jgi:O-antigen ligase